MPVQSPQKGLFQIKEKCSDRSDSSLPDFISFEMPKLQPSLEAVSSTSRWRDFWAKDTKANPSLYKLAEEAQSNKEFRHNLEKTLTLKEQQFIETADLDSLTRVLSDALNQGTRSQERHAELQQTIAKLGKSTVTFANNFSSFLQAYSGIVEIMQGADQQFGGAAYSVLSLLLVVGVNKQRKEEHIDKALLDLQREFSRANSLREVHSSDSMKIYITNVYKLGIEFAREVTLYYSRPT